MAFLTRNSDPGFPAPEGMSRSIIGDWVVDFPIGQQPTLEQVQAQAQPNAAQTAQVNRAAAEALMEDRSPMLRVILAKAVVDYQAIPALRNAHATLGAYLAAIKAMAKSAALD